MRLDCTTGGTVAEWGVLRLILRCQPGCRGPAGSPGCAELLDTDGRRVDAAVEQKRDGIFGESR